MEQIGAGAEAIIYRDGDKVIKDRVRKGYRHPLLDLDLRQSRTRREAKILQKLPINGPMLIETDRKERLTMSFMDGVQLKTVLDEKVSWAKVVGEQLAKLHEANIIHGDLTTSNMIVNGSELSFIDFGLSFTSTDAEHKAVDIHLFKQALESKHYGVYEQAYKEFLKGYNEGERATNVLDRLKVVERRGRNKAKF
ncbi:Kae1-associated serine/threonine protein kinase [Candidatus Woesearchaeota archaeon]|nr:Kae1-associated serine/threonine protein kinase [Candidatus Woesearchaeota archaeon]